MARKAQGPTGFEGGGTTPTGAANPSGAVGTKKAKQPARGPLGTAGVSNPAPTVLGPQQQFDGVAIPTSIFNNIIKQTGADPSTMPTMLIYYPVSGMQHAPSNGKELYEAIQQLATMPGTNQQAVGTLINSLLNAYFPANFNPASKDANKVYAAVSANFSTNRYKLDGLKAPTPTQIYGASGATLLQSIKNQNRQLTVAVNNATAAQEQSAFGTVQNYLESWGLSSAANDVWTLISQQGRNITNTDEILNIMRGSGTSGNPALDRRLTSAYQTAFPGLSTYNSSPGAVHMTEGAYQQYTQAIRDSATQYGAPPPSQKDIGDLLNHNVSASEFNSRVRDISNAIQNSDQNVRNTLEQRFGVTQAHLWDYMTTGSLPTRQRQIASAQLQDYGQRVGLKGLTDANYTQLGEMARVGAGANPLGYGVNQVQNALLMASRDAALTQGQPGQAAPTVSTQQLVGAQLAGFAGTSQPAEQVQVARAEQVKAQPFEKGGGFVETQKGVTGLGSART